MMQSAVESSNVARVGWHNGDLYVEFIKTGVYVYRGVPLDKYEMLITPGVSVGKTLNSEVKSYHPFEKAEWPEATTL